MQVGWERNDTTHISVSELEAVKKGLSLTLKWGLQDSKIKTDSSTVFTWLKSAFTKKKRKSGLKQLHKCSNIFGGDLVKLIYEFNL